MVRLSTAPNIISTLQARRIWLAAQALDRPVPFGSGAAAIPAVVRHLGYVQIDTINVIERCHHHILWTRLPNYRRRDLQQAQSVDKSVFEYWTHALSYLPIETFGCFLPAMRQHSRSNAGWFGTVTPNDLRKVLTRIRDDGPLTIRDIDDDVLVEKNHAWASRKPSKRALQLAFYRGDVAISARSGMLKTYELLDRHFGWDAPPKAATANQIAVYLLDRALTAQGVVSLESICHLDAKRKSTVRETIEGRLRKRRLVPVFIEDSKVEHWATPESIERATVLPPSTAVHLLSPFDPLVIQRKRLKLFFGYEHRFEAYVPKDKRLFGYFALPVLIGDDIVAAIDLKVDRAKRKLLVQNCTWVGRGETAGDRARIEQELHRFEAFQLPAEREDDPV